MLKIDRFLISCQLGIFVVALINFFFNPQGLQVGDSLAYGFGNQDNLNLISFTGHSLRNWPIVSLNFLLKNSNLQILIQTLISATSWSFLIYKYGKSGFTKKREFSFLVSILFMTSQNLTWNATQLAESYSISLLVTLLALVIGFYTEKTTRQTLTFIFLCFIWASIHGRNFSTLIIFFAVFAFYYLFMNHLGKIQKRLSSKSIFTSILVFILFFHVSIVTTNQSKQEYEPGIKYNSLAYTYTFASQPESAKIRSELLKVPEMKCLTLDGTANLYKLVDEMKNSCASANIWLNQDFLKWYSKFLVLNPTTTIKMSLGGILYGNQPTVLYGATLSPLPSSIESIFFGNSKTNLTDVGKDSKSILDSKINSPLLFWILFLIIFLLYKIRVKSNSITKKNLHIIILISLASLIASIFTVLICPAEYFKLTIQMQMLFFLSSSLVFLNFQDN